jgi:hypothetical protein
MFRYKNEAPARTSNYEPLFFEVIQWIQERGDLPDRLLGNDDGVIGVFGLGRRGYSTCASNMGISEADTKRLARWRSTEATVGNASSFAGGTKAIYQEIKLKMNTLLLASNRL